MKYILPLKKIDQEDVELVGRKAAQLGELARTQIPIPEGFVITTAAYHKFLEDNLIKEKFSKLLEGVKLSDKAQLEEAAALVRRSISKASMPAELAEEIKRGYKDLGKGKRVAVAVRSSATAEHVGQESLLNISGMENVLQVVKDVWASHFNGAVLQESLQKKGHGFAVGLAVPIQLMVEAEASGVAFSIDPITNDKTKIVAEAIYGLGKMLSHGAVSPDYFEFEKSSLTQIYSQIGMQDKQMVRVDGKSKEIPVSKAYMGKQKVPDKVLREVAKATRELERHFGRPQEVEWAWDGKKVYVIKSEPTISAVHKVKTPASLNLPQVLKGAPGSAGIASGRVRNVKSAKDLERIGKGDVLVVSQTRPDFGPVMKKISAIVTDRGGRTSDLAVLARELGAPMVVGALEASKKLWEGQFYTVNGSTGEVFEGRLDARSGTLPYESRQTGPAEKEIKTATKIMVNLEDPLMAAMAAAENVDGIGLLKAERMIREIGVHPKAALKNKRAKEYIEQLTARIAEFCQAFGDRPVIYRVADFMSNEYRELEGGSDYEVYESNPMLGLRGAARYIKEPEVFGLELEAIKRVRNVHGHKNLHLLVPFVRTPKELAEIKMLVSSAGLHRGASFKIYMMVRAPSNVLRLADFAKTGIDGVSLDIGELAQLILAIDRSSGRVDEDGEKIDDSVLWCVQRVGEEGREYGLSVGVSGDEVLDPEIAEKLVDWGYSYISVNPDVAGRVRGHVAEAERKLVSKRQKLGKSKG